MKKVLRGKVPLLTSNGKTMVPIEITYDDSRLQQISNQKSPCYLTKLNTKDMVQIISGQIRLPIYK